MTTAQLIAALRSVGACFAYSMTKFVAANDADMQPAYHIHPDAANPRQEDIVRIYTREQLMDWVRTMRAAQRAVDQAAAFTMWEAYEDRWEARV